MKIILLIVITALAIMYYDLQKAENKEMKEMAEEAKREMEEKWSTI